MLSAPRTIILVALTGCGVAPITADTLDNGWKEQIGWPEAAAEGTEPVIITDPGAISGEYSSTLYGGECVVTWSMQGERSDCSGCDFAFYVEMQPIEDDCGAGYTTRGTFMLSRGYVYFDYRRLTPYDLSGNTLTWDSRADDTGDDEPYGYYEYYYDYYGNDYYGLATFLAR